jgi:uncharacterized protein YndB with AHSA1/START domain
MAAPLWLYLPSASPGCSRGWQLSPVLQKLLNRRRLVGEYLELVENALVRYTDQFDDPALPGVIEVSVSFKPAICGTELSIAQAGIPEAIPLEMCCLGWQESLLQLAALVEPEIPG